MAKQHDSAPHELPDSGMGGGEPVIDLTTQAPATDAEIEQGVRSALQLAPDVQADRFTIDVQDGVVRLTGQPRSPEERQRAVDAASCVHGVRQVVD